MFGASRSLVLHVCFIDRSLPLFALLWPRCCLFFFDMRILITLLVSSNSPYGKYISAFVLWVAYSHVNIFQDSDYLFGIFNLYVWYIYFSVRKNERTCKNNIKLSGTALSFDLFFMKNMYACCTFDILIYYELQNMVQSLFYWWIEYNVDHCLSFCSFFLVAIVLSVPRYTDSDYPLCIFKLFLYVFDATLLL